MQRDSSTLHSASFPNHDGPGDVSQPEPDGLDDLAWFLTGSPAACNPRVAAQWRRMDENVA